MHSKTKLNPQLLDKLACPLDGATVHPTMSPRDGLECINGHFYPVVDGIPIMLPDGIAATFAEIQKARELTIADGPLYLETVLLSDIEKQGIKRLAESNPVIDAVAAYLVGATNGIAYKNLVGTLEKYPIPNIRLPRAKGELLLDIGCSWGRWTVSAARQGYRAIGMDPSLGAVMAARRVAHNLNVDTVFVVGDGRNLPFRDGVFDRAFSYSVIQHLCIADATRAIGEVGRILSPGGSSLVQMPTRFGIRCIYNQLRRGFREPQGFEVRYWTISNLRRLFESSVGPSEIEVDCFFGIGWQYSDAGLMRWDRLAVMRASQALSFLANYLPSLTYAADSVYVASRKNKNLS